MEEHNIMREIWECYATEKIPIGKYEVIEIIQNSNGTEIDMESEEHKMIIKFEFADALRVSDEGRRIRTYNKIIEIQNYRKDFNGVPLYEAFNSEFYNWAKKESAGYYTDFRHYVIITMNDIVDIISSCSPEIIVSKL